MPTTICPSEVPKALSEEERRSLSGQGYGVAIETGRRAIEWIDAATALIAQQAGQIVADGARIRELEAQYALMLRSLQAACAEPLAVDLATSLGKSHLRIRALEAQRNESQAIARVRELEVERDVWAERAESEGRAKLEERQKLAAANALIVRARDGFDWQQYDSPEQNQIGRDLDAHLAAQPAAPAQGWDVGDLVDKPAAPSRTEGK